MSRSDVELVATLTAAFTEDLVELFADEERVRRLEELAAPLVDPEMETTFHPVGVIVGKRRGIGGLIDAWRGWVESWASYRIEFEGIFEDDDRVIALARQVGRTLHDAVDVPSSPSAAVFTVREGRVARVGFYLDRTDAAREEGFELP